MAKIISNSTTLLGTNVITVFDPTSRIWDDARIHQSFVVITAQKGPANQVIPLTSEQQGISIFGRHTDDSYARAIFDNVFRWADAFGTQPKINVVRVVGPSAAVASKNIPDENGTNTWRIEAKTKGEWGNKLKVKISDGTKTDYVEDAAAGPILTTATSGGSITAGTYEIGFVWENTNGVTLMSDLESITTTGDASTITITAPDDLPYGATKIKGYVKVSDNMRATASSMSGNNYLTITAIPAGGADEEPSTSTATIKTLKIESKYGSEESYQIWDNFQFTTTDIEKFNADPQNGGHPWLSIVDLDSASDVPENFPAAMSAYLTLTGGTSDNANVDASVIVGTITEGGTSTGLKCFRNDYGPGIVAAPGWSDGTVHTELVDQAESFHRLALLDFAYNESVADAKTWSTGGAVNSEYAAAFMPWWGWANPDYIDGYGERRYWCPPSIQVIGAMHHAVTGFSSEFRPAAGNQFTLKGVAPKTGTETIGGLYADIDNTTATEMGDTYHINVIQNRPMWGPTIYDCVVKNEGTNIKFIPEIMVVNKLHQMVQNAFDRSDLVFSLINSSKTDQNVIEFFDNCKRLCETVMSTMFGMGGFTAVKNGEIVNTPGDAYRIQIDADNNPLSQLEQGIVRIDIYYHKLIFARKIVAVLHSRNLTDPLR